MTDQEKIARMVDWLGGWPEHKTKLLNHLGRPTLACLRCWEDVAGDEVGCESWNPFERIEDAFLLKDRLMGSEHWISFIAWIHCYAMSERNDALTWLFQIQEPARAVAEAAWQVISHFNPDRGST